MNYKLSDKELVTALKEGQVGLLPTDTIYGLSCSAFEQASVERIYDIKGRSHGSSLIILISDITDLKTFRIYLDPDTSQLLSSNWPGKITFILPIEKGFDYLTRGNHSLAFRLPDSAPLRKLLRDAGPLVSTSANPTGKKPAQNAQEANAYFGDNLNFYVDSGELLSSPSTLVDLTGSTAVILRQGETAFRI